MGNTTLQAANRLGLTEPFIRELCRDSKLKASKHGRDWNISDDEIERYARENLGKPGPKRNKPRDTGEGT